jgi:hypothetical protein
VLSMARWHAVRISTELTGPLRARSSYKLEIASFRWDGASAYRARRVRAMRVPTRAARSAPDVKLRNRMAVFALGSARGYTLRTATPMVTAAEIALSALESVCHPLRIHQEEPRSARDFFVLTGRVYAVIRITHTSMTANLA